jgi:hypothetical protein
MAINKDNPGTYYGASGDHGSYRYIPLQEIIESFNATYVGRGKLCESVSTNDVAFHALRAVQELSYDTLRSTKDWEIEVPATLSLVMPIDYVNYVKLAWSDSNGVERIIYPTSKTSNPRDITQTVDTWGGFTTGGASLEVSYAGDGVGETETSSTLTAFQSNTSSDLGSIDSDAVDDVYGNLVGTRFGLDPQHSQINGSFFIDEDAGRFHFSSNLAGKTLVLKYLSDGVAVSASGDIIGEAQIPKLAEEAIYKHILYGVLLARKDTPAGTLAYLKKERFAETRKAKLRLSNIKLEELTQVLRGSSKIIKH